MGLPEPPDASATDNVNKINEIIITETDSEDEVNEYDGYTLLPLGPEETISDVEEDNSQEETEESQNSVPPIVPMENLLVEEVWGKEAQSTSVDIEMDNEKVNEVKRAMSNFTLPSTSIPAWANSVPEETWKQSLMDRLKNLNKNGRHC